LKEVRLLLIIVVSLDLLYILFKNLADVMEFATVASPATGSSSVP